MRQMTLSDKMKETEKRFDVRVAEDLNLIVRLDGHKFSKFTKGFVKPFDDFFSYVMEQVAIDLMKEFSAYTAYTQSDEITLYFPRPQNEKQNQIYGGRIQKIVSLMSAYATLRFNYHFNTDDTTILSKYYDKTYQGYFDARVFGVDDDEVYKAFLDRYNQNKRNSMQQFASTYASHKELLKKTAQEQVDYVKEKYGYDYTQIEDKYKYGIWIKKDLINKNGTYRSKLVSKYMSIPDCITDKYWSYESSDDNVFIKRQITN